MRREKEKMIGRLYRLAVHAGEPLGRASGVGSGIRAIDVCKAC